MVPTNGIILAVLSQSMKKKSSLIGLVFSDEEKTFKTSTPVSNVIKLFTAVIYECL